MLGAKETHNFLSERKNVEYLQVGEACSTHGGEGI
jgi:hypothetical protein